MPDIELPDGSIASFPEKMSDDEIKAVLRKKFPPPRPTSLGPGEVLNRNHATVVLNEEFERFAVYDGAGTFRGFRSTLDAAIDLADAVKPPPPPRVKPKTGPQPETPLSPLVAEIQVCSDVDGHIRRQAAQQRSERRAQQRQRRYKNRGTLA